MNGISTQVSQSATSTDAGGVAARQGFKYQDHIAASFVLEMIGNSRLLRVECETADDIVLYWSSGTSERPEYVQVKTTEADTKWSQKEICARDSGLGAKRPTSLIEKSLLCDSHAPSATFRIVSRRAVNKGLSCLTMPLERRTSEGTVDELARKIGKKWKTISTAGHDLEYWTRNVVWDVTGEVQAVAARNRQTLSLLAEQHGANPTHSHINAIYDDLLTVVDKAAAASRVHEPEEKVIARSAILRWWDDHLAKTDAAIRKTSKPYRATTEGFFAQLHEITEANIRRALTGYDVRYERQRWRSEQLAEYLAEWLPEVALKASELVEVQHLNLRHKLQAAIQEIERHREINIERLLAEMMLHAVLRHQLQSEPIACKLFYQSRNGTKSFGNAHIVHSREATDELWLGRATIATAPTYEAVLNALLEELTRVLDPDFLKEERNVIVTLREPQHMLPTTLESAFSRNTPVDDLVEVLCVPILVAYDSQVLGRGFAREYRDALIAEVTDRYEGLKALIPGEISTVKVHIFLVPIESVTTLIQQFASRLGV